VQELLDQIEQKGLPKDNIKLNISGNGIYTMRKYLVVQHQIDKLVTEIIRGLQDAGITIAEIRSGG
jgi:hypothetical protein